MIDSINTIFDENYDFDAAQFEFETFLKMAVSKLFESRIQGEMLALLDDCSTCEVTLDDVDLIDMRDFVLDMVNDAVVGLFSGLAEE